VLHVHQLTAFEPAEMILHAALDPNVASKVKRGDVVRRLDHLEWLQSPINGAQELIIIADYSSVREKNRTDSTRSQGYIRPDAHTAPDRAIPLRQGLFLGELHPCGRKAARSLTDFPSQIASVNFLLDQHKVLNINAMK
jgi:hypothetical protein